MATKTAKKNAEGKVIHRYKSRSEDGVTHRVIEHEGGMVSCTCKGYRYNGRCWHTEGYKLKPVNTPGIKVRELLRRELKKLGGERAREYDKIDKKQGRLRAFWFFTWEDAQRVQKRLQGQTGRKPQRRKNILWVK